MKKLSRIIMFVILTLLMLLPMACTITPEKGANGLVYELDLLTNTYTVVDYKAAKDDIKIVGNKILVEEVVIPSTFNGRPVAKIGINAFKQSYSTSRHDYAEYTDFTSGRSSIDVFNKNNGDLAYYAKVQKVVIPASVKTIDDFAFQSCSELVEIEMSDSVSSIGKSAFSGCVALTTITLSDNENAETNQLPSAIKKINDGTFFKCTSLESVYIPDSVTSIGKLAFASCYSLDSIKVERATGNDYVMVGSLSEIDRDDKDGVNISSIDNYAFKDATGMEYFNVPDSVKKFGVAVFEMPNPNPAESYTISSLKGASFSSHIKELGPGMFKNCVSLDEEELDLSEVETIGEGIFEGCTSLTSIQLNGKITKIPARAYYGCTGIETIDLTQYQDPDSGEYKETQVSYIGEAAFRGCSSLRSIELGDDKTSKITDIKRYAFKDCPNLRSIYIPQTAIRIDPRVFENSGGTVIYAKDVTSTESGEMIVRAPGWENGSANLIKNFESIVYVDIDGNEVDKVTELDKVVAEYVVLSKKSGKANLARYVDFDNETYTLPVAIKGEDDTLYDVSNILKAAFKNCANLTNIEFASNNNIATIESEAFANITNVKTLDLSATQITKIPEKAFAYSGSLTQIALPDDVNEVKESAFENCVSLQNMDLSSVATLGKAIFKNCEELESVTLGAITAFPEQIFYNAKSLSKIDVANIANVKQINSRAFYGCESLNENNFSIGNMTGLTTIGNEAFYNCSGYETITIPSSLTTIGSKVFTGCTSLKGFDCGDNPNFETEDSILYSRPTKPVDLTVNYLKASSDLAVGQEVGTVTVKVSYRSAVVFYPSLSATTDLTIDMFNTYSLGDIYDIAKEANGGNDVYAVSCTLTNFTTLFVRGNTYVTTDGKKISITKDKNNIITKFTNTGNFEGDNDYILGRIGNSKINDYAFDGAANLETVTIYGNVTLGTGVFNNCAKLKSITVNKVSDDDQYANLAGDATGILYKGKYDKDNGTFEPSRIVQFPAGFEVDRYVVPESIEGFEPNAFSMVKRIGTLVLNDKIGWEGEAGLEKALINANIGRIEINSKAEWVITKDKDGVESHSLQLYTGEDDSDNIYENTNGKFIIDNYGVLYSVNISSTTVTIDGVTVTTRFLNYNQLIYVPADIDFTDRALTIPNGCTVQPYAFASNDTLKTIIMGRKVSMVSHSFDGCSDLTIYYQSSRIDYEDLGYLDEANYLDDNGEETNTAIRDAKVYYYSVDRVSSDEYEFWHYKSALDDQTGGVFEYNAAEDSRVPAELDGSPLIHQDNELLANYGYEYQLAVNEEGQYYQDDAGNWVIETNNFGELQFVYELWDNSQDEVQE